MVGHGVRVQPKQATGQLMPTALATRQVEAQPCRTTKRRHSDATIARHVAILEQVARQHDGVLPPYKWLEQHGHFASYEVMRQYPHAFAHIKTSTDKKFEIYQAQEKVKTEGVGHILPPAQARSIAEYNVPGASFNPTHLHIEPGTAEGDWLQIGRSLASVCQSAYWWVGDWLLYGFKTYGVQATFDLAQQATGYSRSQLHECSYLAKRFPPERRNGALSFYHHKSVATCPPAMADKLLAEANELGLTGRQIREMGAEAMGKPQRKAVKAKHIKLAGCLMDDLRARAGGHDLSWFVGRIIMDWLDGKVYRETQGESDAAVMATDAD